MKKSGKKLTEEQLQNIENRKILFKTVQNMTDNQKSDLITKFGTIYTCDQHPLSNHNMCLILTQAKDFQPSIVGGFHQWKDKGRIIKPGSKALYIRIPCEKPDKDGMYFLAKPVFDISQTITTEEFEHLKGKQIAAPGIKETENTSLVLA